MPIHIPKANIHQPMLRNAVSQIAKDGFLPVVALEAFVEAGRTYQAYKRGGFDEARERITEEFSGAVFWIGGVTALNALFEKIGQKMLKLPKDPIDIAKDEVRNPLGNFLKKGSVLESTMAKFKVIKVLSSILIANAFIGFALPKINQAITRSYHKNKAQTQEQPMKQSTSFFGKPSFDNFTNNDDNKKNKKDISFGINWLSVADKFENNRNYKLLAVDAGTASGRTISARNNDERVEILFRDLSSIYFYMFNMSNLNKWLNKLEQNGNGRRLDPMSAEFSTQYMENYLKSIGGRNTELKDVKVSIDKFAKDMLGEQVEIPQSLIDKFEGEKIKTIKLKDFKPELKNIVPAEKVSQLEIIAEEMSKLQPELLGERILTKGQVQDILSGGHINNPEFLQEFFKNRFGTKFTESYKYVAQNDLDAIKKDLVEYVKSIISEAKKNNLENITHDMLRKASNKNLKMNALNWGAGFITSALFLSTFIPKLQYLITKIRTGSDSFPGTAQYREEEKKVS